ncbi:MAG TPA: glycosyltransferase [Anaerolineales bacterium]|jgi:glycosyltransferase involved in cell wall biosynthesis
MRIGMLVDTYKPHVSGITNYIDLSKRHLEKAGHDVYVITFGRRGQADDEPHVLRSPGLPLGSTGYYFALRYSSAIQRILQTMDVVQVHHPFLSGSLALRYCRPAGIPIVFTNHTRYDLYARTYLPLLPEAVSRRFLKSYMASFCAAVDLVISPSAGMQAVLRGLGVTAPIEVVPNGINLDLFNDATSLQRSAMGFDESDILLVYAGRVAREKNVDFLLRAFAKVAAQVKNARLLIIGGGQKPIADELKAQAAELGLSERVTFVGLIAYDSLPGYLAMCDVFVTASVSEVHPLSVIEAMAAGLPVIGIESPGVGDTVQDGTTGFLAPDDMAAFSDKVTRLCLDRELIGRMGDAARRASSAYSIERTTATMLEHYQRLISEPRPQRRSRQGAGVVPDVN